MKAFIACLLLCVPCFAQNPDAEKYASRSVMLVGAEGEGVLIYLFTDSNLQQHLEFVPTSKVTEATARGGKPITFGYISSALAGTPQPASAPEPPKPTVVVVQQQAPQPSAAELEALRKQQLLMMWMQMNKPQAPPPLLIKPYDPNAGRVQANCTTNRIGDTTYTNCH